MLRKAHEKEAVLIVPLYEKEVTGVYYNTAVVIDADGSVLGKYRKSHIPDDDTGWEKFYFKPGNLGYPVFNTRYAKVGICICYDRYFPEGWRTLGLNGAEIVFNPSQTIVECAGFWEVMQPAHALSNGYFVATVNRVGVENEWQFAGRSYVCNPRAEIFVRGSEDREDLVVADIDLGMIKKARHLRAYYRDRRQETYGRLVE
jgi:N-carbamoylputrescine amidase